MFQNGSCKWPHGIPANEEERRSLRLTRVPDWLRNNPVAYAKHWPQAASQHPGLASTLSPPSRVCRCDACRYQRATTPRYQPIQPGQPLPELQGMKRKPGELSPQPSLPPPRFRRDSRTTSAARNGSDNAPLAVTATQATTAAQIEFVGGSAVAVVPSAITALGSVAASWQQHLACRSGPAIPARARPLRPSFLARSLIVADQSRQDDGIPSISRQRRASGYEQRASFSLSPPRGVKRAKAARHVPASTQPGISPTNPPTIRPPATMAQPTVSSTIPPVTTAEARQPNTYRTMNPYALYQPERRIFQEFINEQGESDIGRAYDSEELPREQDLEKARRHRDEPYE